MLNKLMMHPQVRGFKNSLVPQEQLIYKEYNLLYQRLPLILKEIEELKVEIEQKHQQFIKLEQARQTALKLQEERFLQQRKLYGNYVPKEEPVDDDDDFFDKLKSQKLTNHDVSVDITPEYPKLPVELSNFEIPSLAPQLPSKEPEIPEKHLLPADVIEHKTVNFTEGGLPLRTIFVSSNLKLEFLKISNKNTQRKLETCGILAGKLSRNAFFITHLLIPEQISTSNTCETVDEESLFFTVDKLDLFILGWIHTHPTQSCFLSSVDLHTQNSYQIMLNEAIAIVLSPDPRFTQQDFGCFRLTDPPGLPTISKCNRSGFHPHEESNLYVTCNRVNNDVKMGHVVIKDHLPFEIIDLRKKRK